MIMLDQLRIQCPSCGIILDIRNSKHEAIKQIVCPNCKKRLAVNFEEELEPLAPLQPIEPLYYGEMRIDLKEGVNKISFPDSDKVEIKVVRLKDGNSKCMIRPLSDTTLIKVNGQQLQADEQIVLSKGDYLEIGKTCLRAGELGSLTPSSQDNSDDQGGEQPTKPHPQKERNYVWLYAVLAFVALMGATILLWPKEPAKSNLNQELAQVLDTVKGIDTISKVEPEVKGVKKDISIKRDSGEKPQVKPNDVSSLSEYDLERLAVKGDIEAQYEIGVKLIKKGGVSNVVRGINYLKAAAKNGSSKARTALSKAINSLQKQANQGDSISYYILKSI